MKTGVLACAPLLVAASLFAWLQPAATVGAPGEPRRGLALDLPMPARATEVPSGTYDLVEERSRFVLTAENLARTVRARTSSIHGWLRHEADGARTMELTIDLASLGPVDGAPPREVEELRAALLQSLGFVGLEPMRFVGRATETTDIPRLPLARVTWVGRVDLAGPGHGLSLELWQVTPGNGRIHAQGVVEVDGESWRVPRRYFLGLLPDPVHLTLGFDLEFAARP